MVDLYPSHVSKNPLLNPRMMVPIYLNIDDPGCQDGQDKSYNIILYYLGRTKTFLMKDSFGNGLNWVTPTLDKQSDNSYLLTLDAKYTSCGLSWLDLFKFSVTTDNKIKIERIRNPGLQSRISYTIHWNYY